MKIAQIAPLMESVPPRLYGGTERIVSYLTDELVRQGHEVTLFASGDSVTTANLVSCAPMALRLDANVRDLIPYYMLMLDRVRRYADEFDILHFHIDQFHFPLFRHMADRTVTTTHGRQDLPDLKPLYIGFCDMPLVSISNAQRRPVANANFVATVHHGIPANLLQAHLPAARRISGVSRSHLAGEAARSRHRDRAGSRDPAEDRGQGRQGRRGLFPREDRAAARPTGHRIHRRDQRARQDRVPGRGAGAAVPDRLAGAVRTVHDRSHGLRHAGARLPLRLGARDHRPWRHRRDRRHDGRGGRDAAAGACARSARGPTALRRTVHRHAAWPRTTFRSTIRCSSGRRCRSATRRADARGGAGKRR